MIYKHLKLIFDNLDIAMINGVDLNNNIINLSNGYNHFYPQITTHNNELYQTDLSGIYYRTTKSIDIFYAYKMMFEADIEKRIDESYPYNVLDDEKLPIELFVYNISY